MWAAFFGRVFSLVPGFLGTALDAMAGVLGGVLGAVARIFHVLLKAGIGALGDDGGQSNGKNGGYEAVLRSLAFIICLTLKTDSKIQARVVATET